MSDLSIREQRALLKAMAPSDEPPRLFPPEPVIVERVVDGEVVQVGMLLEIERRLVCTRHGGAVFVGPCFEHLDAATFVCGACLSASGEVETGDLAALAETLGQDGTGNQPAETDAGAGTAGNGQERHS